MVQVRDPTPWSKTWSSMPSVGDKYIHTVTAHTNTVIAMRDFNIEYHTIVQHSPVVLPVNKFATCSCFSSLNTVTTFSNFSWEHSDSFLNNLRFFWIGVVSASISCWESVSMKFPSVARKSTLQSMLRRRTSRCSSIIFKRLAGIILLKSRCHHLDPTRPAIAAKNSDPTWPAARPFPYMYSL